MKRTACMLALTAALAILLNAKTSRPLPYEAEGTDIRRVIEAYAAARGGSLVLEGDRPVGIEAPWGGITLEPGGQVEWSSRPAADLTTLGRDFDAHARTMRQVAEALGAAWLDVAVEPETPVSEMPWMPKARYGIMRETMAAKGRLALAKAVKASASAEPYV